jgi:aspartyl-tRNA(Asn)/glutamyl-tRNA(Gln) amidotransferase subunit B
VRRLDQGEINAQGASEVIVLVATTGTTAAQAIQVLGVRQISDEEALSPVVDEVLQKNGKMAQDYLKGKQAAIGALVGQVMKATRGKADPKLANALLRRKLDAMR